MTDSRNSAAAFMVLAAPFFVNDFGFIAADGGYGVYLVDYGTRALVLALCFLWALPRGIVLARPDAPASPWFALIAIAVLLALGRLSYYLIEVPFVAATGLGGLFAFPAIDDPTLMWLDLTLGVFAVALSEELVFRKLALRWLEDAGRSPLQIVVISALAFSLMHWASGVPRLLYTFAVGLIYMAAYLRLKSLWPLIAAHWLEDFIAFGGLGALD